MELLQKVLDDNVSVIIYLDGRNEYIRHPSDIDKYGVKDICKLRYGFWYSGIPTEETLIFELLVQVFGAEKLIQEDVLDVVIGRKHFQIAKYLIDHGTMLKDDTLFTLIGCEHCWTAEHDDMMNYLISKGLNIHCKKTTKDRVVSLIEYALENKLVSWPLVEKLLRLGVEPPFVISKENYIPLCLAQSKIREERMMHELGELRDVNTILVDFLKAKGMLD